MRKGILSVLLAAAGMAACAAAGAGAVAYQKARQHEKDFEVIKKNEAILKMFNQWLIAKQEGRPLADYFRENGYQKIAIYGMSYAGERLLDDLKGTGIEVAYAVDQKADRIFAETKLVTKEGIPEREPVDAVVVTAIYWCDEIEEELGGLVDCPVISLEDILYGL